MFEERDPIWASSSTNDYFPPSSHNNRPTALSLSRSLILSDFPTCMHARTGTQYGNTCNTRTHTCTRTPTNIYKHQENNNGFTVLKIHLLLYSRRRPTTIWMLSDVSSVPVSTLEMCILLRDDYQLSQPSQETLPAQLLWHQWKVDLKVHVLQSVQTDMDHILAKKKNLLILNWRTCVALPFTA